MSGRHQPEQGADSPGALSSRTDAISAAASEPARPLTERETAQIARVIRAWNLSPEHFHESLASHGYEIRPQASGTARPLDVERLADDIAQAIHDALMAGYAKRYLEPSYPDTEAHKITARLIATFATLRLNESAGDESS